jgi:N-acetylmuramoyl-L-alanine amidase
VLTRSSDVFISLGRRCEIANSNRGAIFVSIHFNSAARTGASGIETYSYGSRTGASLAASIHREVLRSTGAVDRGVRQRRYYVLRNSRIPAVLAELGFLTNPSEASRIVSSSYRQKLAEAVARGITSKYH